MSSEVSETAELRYANPLQCPHCEEPIVAGDDTRQMKNGLRWHTECLLRSFLGSVGHQRRECSCYGGEGDGDPPGLSLREAAKAAKREWELHRLGIELRN